MKPLLTDISIRTDFQPGDIGYIVHLHGSMYSREYGYGIQFECYVAEGLVEFYRQYTPERNRVWICEHHGKIVGFLALMDRGAAAQLRYFIILPEFRGIGLGKKLMHHYINFMKQKGFQFSYLWTTDELPAAASLYTRYGFNLVEQIPSDAFGKPVIERKYELTLY